MKVGDLVTWTRQTPHDKKPKVGLWEIVRIEFLKDFDGPHQPLGQAVKLRWVCGWRMYHDQKKACRQVSEVRLVDDLVATIAKIVDNEMLVLALAARLK